jgi:hypothetical protein
MPELRQLRVRPPLFRIIWVSEPLSWCRLCPCFLCHLCLALQELLLTPIPQLLGLNTPSNQQQQQQGLPGSAAGGSSAAGPLLLQAWNFTGMLTGGGLGNRGGQNPAGGPGHDGGQGGNAAFQQGHSAAAVDDAISKAHWLRERLYGQQLMQGFDPQELRMVREGWEKRVRGMGGRGEGQQEGGGT